MSKGTDRRSVRVAPKLWEAAQTIAAQRDDTLSDIIRQALEAYTMTTRTVLTAEALDFLTNHAWFPRSAAEQLGAVKAHDTYCYECHDWHEPDAEHTMDD